MGQIPRGSARVVVMKWGVKERSVISRKTKVDGTERLIKFKTHLVILKSVFVVDNRSYP